MLVAGQGVADQDGVGAVGVQRPEGSVGDLETGQAGAGIQAQGLVRPEPYGPAVLREGCFCRHLVHQRLG